MVISVWRSGAGEGIRTLDPLLGKQMLCQLSYARLRPPILAHAVAPGSDAYQRLFCEVVSKRRASVLIAVDVRLWINGSSIIWPLGTVIEALLPKTVGDGVPRPYSCPTSLFLSVPEKERLASPDSQSEIALSYSCAQQRG